MSEAWSRVSAVSVPKSNVQGPGSKVRRLTSPFALTNFPLLSATERLLRSWQLMTKVATIHASGGTTDALAKADADFYLPAEAFFRASLPTALTYDDVSLATLYSEILPRD